VVHHRAGGEEDLLAGFRETVAIEIHMGELYSAL
jgi:hypothetical protein